MTIIPIPRAQEARGHAFTRDRLRDAIERLMALLDALDADCDLEPDACAELSSQHEIRGGANVRAA